MKITRIFLVFVLFCFSTFSYAQANKKSDVPCQSLKAISGVITHETFDTVTEINNHCLSKGHKATLNIFSPGGDADAGIGIYDMIKSEPGSNNLTTRGFGEVASAATLIFLAGKERLISCNSRFMIHNVTSTISNGKFSSKDFQNLSRSIIETNKSYVKIYAAATNIAPEKIQSMMEEETVLTAKEAVQMGFATGTIPTQCP